MAKELLKKYFVSVSFDGCPLIPACWYVAKYAASELILAYLAAMSVRRKSTEIRNRCADMTAIITTEINLMTLPQYG